MDKTGKIYLIADPHFNHDRDFIYKPRGFNSVEEMNEALIERWNKVVTEYDDVYVLGDFFLGTDEKFIKETIGKLNGFITLIRGNHDTDAKMHLYRNHGFVYDTADAKFLKYKKRTFFLSHYPTLTSDLQTEPSKYVYNLFGHTHSQDKFYMGRPYMYNVAADAHDCTPVCIDTIIADINEKIKEHKEMRDALMKGEKISF